MGEGGGGEGPFEALDDDLLDIHDGLRWRWRATPNTGGRMQSAKMATCCDSQGSL